MKGIFKRPYLPMSGMPANDDRVTDIVRLGRDKMPAYGQVLNQQQISDLLGLPAHPVVLPPRSPRPPCALCVSRLCFSSVLSVSSVVKPLLLL